MQKLPRLLSPRITKRLMSNFPDNSVHEALPTLLTPLHYKVHLFDIDVKKNTFSGLVNLRLAVNAPTSSITLNQKKLRFQSAKVVASITKTQTEIPVTAISTDDKKETVDLALEGKPLESGHLDVEIRYTGELRTDMAGFYTSHYETTEGATEYVLVTQFEAAEARSAFPCFDEPNRKATFDFSAVVDKDVDVLSNMPLLSSKTLDSGKKGPGFDKPLKCVQFETTPKMSTYLVAWAIGKFEYIETQTEKSYRGKPLTIRVYTQPGQSKTGELALDVAKKDVDFLSKIFDVDYPLPKLDLVAVPFFGAHAMENWGMVTFRATALLYDADKSDKAYQQSVAYVVSHEIAHSWFGNYVTMNWWSDLWLNESFATFVGELCVDNMHEDWETFPDFVTTGLEVALDLDSLHNSHPIEVGVNTAAEIDEIFDHISYLKGGSIIRMVASTVGVDTFLKGVSVYLKKYAFGNAKSDDLWDAVSAVSGRDITTLVAPWIRAIGFPYVSVKQVGDELLLEQKRFFAAGAARASEDQIVWWIPNIPALENSKTGKIPAAGFTKLNKDTTGFYRVVYDEKSLATVLSHLDEFSIEDRIGLVGDIAAAAQAGLLKTSKFLELLSLLKTEDDVNVWMEVIKRLGTLKQVFFSEPKISEQLNAFARDLYKTQFEKLYSLPLGSLTLPQTKLLSLLFAEVGLAGLPEAITNASNLYATEINPSFKLPVYRTLLSNEKTCTKSVYDAVLKDVVTPSSIDSTEIALQALGSIANTKQFLQPVLDLYFSKDLLEMNYIFLTTSLVQNSRTKVAFWNFFKEKYSLFKSDVAMWTLDRVLKTFLPDLVSKELYSDVTEFFADKDTTGYTKGLAQSLDAIKNRLSWLDFAKDDVAKWLSEKEY